MSFRQTRPKFGESQTQHISNKQLMPTVKHGGGGLMIWARFVAAAPEHLAII